MSTDINEEQRPKDIGTNVGRKGISAILKEFLIVYVSETTRTPVSINDRENAIVDCTTDIDVTSTNENSTECKIVTDKVNNTSFINGLLEFALSADAWEAEKIELLLTVKQCFINYSGNSNQLTDVSMTFQEFYTRNLQVVLNRHFNEVLQRIPAEKETCVVKLTQLQQYLKQCFEVYGQDSLYVHVREQYNRLYDYNKQIQELNAKHALLDEKQAKLNVQQTEIETKQKAIDEAISRANESITQQSQKVAESSITILGIFVGIVMVFFGDFSILSSAAVGIFEVPIHRLMLVFVSFGAILFNVIILLFYLVSKITQKSIGSVCMYSTACDRTVCQSCKHKPKFATLCKLRNTQPYVYYGNAVILLLFVFALSMYGLSGLQIELLTQKIQPFDLAIHIYDTRSQKDITVLQLILSGVITACVAICMFKVGKPHKTIQTTKT